MHVLPLRCLHYTPLSFVSSSVKEADLLSSVRERYTTVKRLVVSPASADGSSVTTSQNVLVEVQFTGPQPSEGPGALLRDLLCGSSVEAKPVELPRGRKKRARTDPTSSEASDSGTYEVLCFYFDVLHFPFVLLLL